MNVLKEMEKVIVLPSMDILLVKVLVIRCPQALSLCVPVEAYLLKLGPISLQVVLWIETLDQVRRGTPRICVPLMLQLSRYLVMTIRNRIPSCSMTPGEIWLLCRSALQGRSHRHRLLHMHQQGQISDRVLRHPGLRQ